MADFGIASFRNDSFPGANSEPLAINDQKKRKKKRVFVEITEDLDSEV